MFDATGKTVMIEVVEREQEIKLHLPDSAKSTGAIHDLVVASVGEEVTKYKVGDRVLTPLPKNGQVAQFDNGNGNGNGYFVFWEEDDLFGKFKEEK